MASLLRAGRARPGPWTSIAARSAARWRRSPATACPRSGRSTWPSSGAGRLHERAREIPAGAPMKAAWLALVLCCASPAIAAVNSDPAPGFPSKPIRWIVGFTPGASNDVVARTVAQRLTEIWGQQIIIDNRPGAGGMIGGEMVARGAPDGYTVLLATGGPNIGNPLLMKKPPYKVEDFAYVAIAADNPLILVVTPSFPAKTPREFVDYLKANPGKVNWATSGINSTPHVSMAIFT